MPEVLATGKAKAAITELLGSLGIEKVYCVDDYYVQRLAIDDILAAQRKLAPEQLVGLVPELGSVPDDKDVRGQILRRAWEQLNSTERAALGERIMTLA